MKKILFLVTILASLFIIKDLLYSIYTLWHKNDLLIVAQKELSVEKKKNMELQSQLSQVQKGEFIEQEARNKLFLVRPGENSILMPQKQRNEVKPEVLEVLPNWQQWVNLFFPNSY